MLWFRSRKNREQDLEREIRSDLELEAAELQQNGLSAEDARYAALRAFGNASLVKEDVRATWGARWFDDFSRDLRYTMRDLLKSPGFAATVLVTLAVGIGATTAIFTIMNAVFLKSLPVRDPRSLVLLGDGRGSGDEIGIPRSGSFSLYSYDLYKQLNKVGVFAELGAVQSSQIGDVGVRFAGWSEPQLAQAKLVSGNYFDVLGVKAAMGRAIAPSDDAQSAPPVAVVSFRFWNQKLGADPSVIGSTLYVSRTAFTIVGVASPEFFGETLKPDPPSFWLPLSADRLLNGDRALIDNPEEHWLYLIGRLAPGVSTAQAQRRLTAVLHNWLLAHEGSEISWEQRERISRTYVELTAAGSGVVHMQRSYSLTLRSLLGISIAVLLITCANIANLLLARGAARSAEISVRIALGATGERLIRQSLTESLTLAFCGGALALLLASAGTKLLIALFFHGTDYVPIRTSPDLRVLAFTFVVSCSAAIVFGLFPAIRTSAQADEIKSASSGIKGSRMLRRSFGLGKALSVIEIAVSLVVLAGAGTFARSLANLNNQQFGFNREHVLIVKIDTAHAGYDYSRLGSLYRTIDTRLNSLPGIKSATFSYYSPFDNCCWAFSISVQGYTPKPGEEMRARLNRVWPGYFQTVGTKLLLGRTFNQHDVSGSQAIAIVNEEFVRRFLPDQDPIGRHFGIGGERRAGDLEIIGVTGNAKYESPREESTPMAFLPLLQMKPGDSGTFPDESNFANVIEVLCAGNPTSIASEVRHALAAIDPDLPVLRVTTLSDDIKLMLNQENVTAALASFFGLLALLLSCLGVYGLMIYSVQRRIKEIGVRIALGARRASVAGMVIQAALIQGSIGIAIGIPAAFTAVRIVRNQLYGVSPNDPKYSAAAALILLLCMTIAACLPALRASRVDPVIALRHE